MTPELIVCGILLVAITLYAILGGADFGAGVWEFNTAMRSSKKERDLLYRAIGPVWEVNHVWLIFALVLMFSAFPIAFAALCRALWIPLLLALLGIFARSVGFAFREYAAGAVRQQALFGAVFAFASTSTPFFFGACAGAIAGGLPVDADGKFHGDHLTGWITPLSVFCSFYAVGLCSYISALFMSCEAQADNDPELTVVWSRRALTMGVILGIFSALGLVIVSQYTPDLWQGFRSSSLPLVATSAVTGFISMLCVWKARYKFAAGAAALTVASVILGWGVAQYPLIVPPAINVHTTKAPEAVLWAMIIAVAAGAVVLIPSLGWLFYLFKGKHPGGSKTAATLNRDTTTNTAL
jgi:cytochrome d ubiquinol oxidase subunit II